MLAIFAAAFVSRSPALGLSGLAFGLLSCVHWQVFGGLSAYNFGYYYATAALFDAVSVLCVCWASTGINKDWYLYPLSIVIMLSIVNNLIGLFVWWAYLPPEFYNLVGVGIYSAVILILAGSRLNVQRLFKPSSTGSIHSFAGRLGCLLSRSEPIKWKG